MSKKDDKDNKDDKDDYEPAPLRPAAAKSDLLSGDDDKDKAGTSKGDKNKSNVITGVRSEHSHHIDLDKFSNSSDSRRSSSSTTSTDRVIVASEDEATGFRQQNRSSTPGLSRSRKGKSGSRSTSNVDLGQGHDDNCCWMEGSKVTESQESEVSMICTGKGCDRHFTVDDNVDYPADELSTSTGDVTANSSAIPSAGDSCVERGQATCEHRRDVEMVELCGLVGGLDSHIKTLCWNLRKLPLLTKEDGSDRQTQGQQTDNVESKVTGADDTRNVSNSEEIDGPQTGVEELYYDCITVENEEQTVSAGLKELTEAQTKQDGDAGNNSQNASSTVDPPKHQVAKKEQSPATSLPYSEAQPAGSGSKPDTLAVEAGFPSTSPDFDAASLTATKPWQPVTSKSESDGGVSDLIHQHHGNPKQMSPKQRQKQIISSLKERLARTSVMATVARSLPTLSGAVGSAARILEEESAGTRNVYEVCSETLPGSSFEDGGFPNPVFQQRLKGLQDVLVCVKGQVSSRELQQLLEQSAMLQDMWTNHKRQLRDVLANQRREAARASGLDQALSRGRQAISALRRQRQELHECLENREQELNAALKRHKNENSLLRNKLLGYLKEKQTSLAESKCEHSRLAAILDSLLCLHLNREHFMALDIAKQNKINELTLLVRRQQLAMEELREDNQELNQALTKLMQFIPDAGKTGQVPNQPRSTSHPQGRVFDSATPSGRGYPGSRQGLSMSDVLHCDRSFYFPHASTSPELAAVTVFQVGGEDGPSVTSAPEQIFDASLQPCNFAADYKNLSAALNSNDANPSLAEDLLQQLSIIGPGSAGFTLADVQQ